MLRRAHGIVDDRADERDVDGLHDRLGHERGLGRVPARVVVLTLAVPLDEQACSVTGARKGKAPIDARRDAHTCTLSTRQRRVEILYLYRDRVHSSTEAVDEALHR